MAVKEQVIRLKADVGDAKRQIDDVNAKFAEQQKQLEDLANTSQEAGRSLTEINAGAELAAKGMELLNFGLEATLKFVERGQAFSELSNAFDNLYGKSVTLGQDGLGKLREALQGTVSDVEILKSANQAAQAGLSAEDFLVVAQAAETLGDKIGKGPNETLEQLGRALATGQERQLKFLVGTIDNAKVQEEFAKTLGTTADKLSESGKLAAVQAEVIKRLKAEIEGATSAQRTAGDELEVLTAAYQNQLTAIGNAVNNNADLRDTFVELKGVVQSIDPQAVAAIFVAMAKGAKKAADIISDLAPKVAAFLSPKEFIAGKVLDDQKQLIKNAHEYGLELDTAGQLLDNIAQAQARVANLEQRTGRGTQTAAFKAELERAKGEVLGYTRAYDALRNSLDQGEAPTKKATEGLINTGKGAADAAEKVEKLRDEFSQLGSKTELTGLQKELENAIERVDRSSFDSISTNIEESFRRVKTEELTAKYGKAVSDADIAGEVSREWEIAAKDYEDKFKDASNKVAKQAADDMKKAQDEIDKRFKASADFFSEAVYNSMTGVAFDLEDLFKRVFAGVVGGFLSQITGGFGAGLGTPQGIGQIFGMILGGGTPSWKQADSLGSLGQILGITGSDDAALALTGSATALDASAAALTGAAASLGGSGIASSLASGFQLGGTGISPGGFDFGGFPLGGGASAGGVGLAGNFASLGLGSGLAAGSAIILTGAAGVDFGRSISKGQNTNLASSVALAPVTGGLSLLGLGAGSILGGGGLNANQAHTGGIIDDLIGRGILGDRGTFSTAGGGEGRLQASRGGDLAEGAGEYAGLTNLFSLVTEGDIDEQFSGLFANALQQAGSFNEALLTVGGLLDKAGISAEQAGQLATDAYLDGKISLDEYNSALATTDQLAQNSIDDLDASAQLLADSFGGTPREQLKALQIEFQSLKDKGIDSASEVVDYFQGTFGPDSADAIQDMVDAGIDIFGDFSKLTVPQLQLVLNEIRQMSGDFEDVGDAGYNAAARIANGADKAAGSIRLARKEAQGLSGDLKNAASAGSGSNSPGVAP